MNLFSEIVELEFSDIFELSLSPTREHAYKLHVYTN